MRTRKLTVIGVTCAMAIAMAACGSDDEEPSGDSAADSSGGSGGSQTIKLGIVTPLSGPAAATYGPAARSGVEARLAAYQEEGGQCADNTFEIVEADTVDPAGALASSQRHGAVGGRLRDPVEQPVHERRLRLPHDAGLGRPGDR